MPDTDVRHSALDLIEGIAGAIRRELGEEVDAYPGHRSPEAADPLNRAFRAVTRWVMSGDGVAPERLPALVTRALRVATERRLAADSWDDHHVRLLIDLEPGTPDDWLPFLLLSSRPQIAPLLTPADPA